MGIKHSSEQEGGMVNLPKSEYMKRYRQRPQVKRHLKKQQRAYYQKCYRKYKQEYVTLLGGKCSRCGYDKYFGALEFHHLNPKDKESGLIVFNAISPKFRQKILDGKIQLLCSNCHKEIHNGNNLRSAEHHTQTSKGETE